MYFYLQYSVDQHEIIKVNFFSVAKSYKETSKRRNTEEDLKSQHHLFRLEEHSQFIMFLFFKAISYTMGQLMLSNGVLTILLDSFFIVKQHSMVWMYHSLIIHQLREILVLCRFGLLMIKKSYEQSYTGFVWMCFSFLQDQCPVACTYSNHVFSFLRNCQILPE